MKFITKYLTLFILLICFGSAYAGNVQSGKIKNNTNSDYPNSIPVKIMLLEKDKKQLEIETKAIETIYAVSDKHAWKRLNKELSKLKTQISNLEGQINGLEATLNEEQRQCTNEFSRLNLDFMYQKYYIHKQEAGPSFCRSEVNDLSKLKFDLELLLIQLEESRGRMLVAFPNFTDSEAHYIKDLYQDYYNFLAKY